MSLTIQDYINEIQNSNNHIYIAKMQILDWNENVLEEVTDDIISIDLTLNNQFGQRRNANIVLQNKTGKYTPIFRGSIWLNSKIKLYSGLNINGEDYFVNKGLFVISEVQAISNGAEKIVNITALDKFSILDGTITGALAATYIIPVGTSIPSAIRALLTDAGEIKNPIITNTSEVTPYTITQEFGGTYGDILKLLADMLSWDCFFDNFGFLRFQPSPVDYVTGLSNNPSIWDFSTEEVTLQNSNHRYKFDSIKNYVVVTGDNIGGLLVKATAQDDNIFSSTNITRLGQKILPINDNIIQTIPLAQDRANWELYKAINLQESVDLSAYPVDIINENDIITVYDISNGLDRSRFLINSINFPFLNNGSMTVNAWKIRSFS